MIDKIKSIRKSLANDNYLAALALALTIPDICGQVEFPNESKVGKRYKDWYNKYCCTEYNGPQSPNVVTTLPKLPDFTAENCYKLRCAVLHSGNIEINAINFNEFKLTKDGETCSAVETVTSNGKSKTTSYVYLNTTRFCNIICDVAEKYYNKHKSDFSRYHIEIQ
ncbi:hypothetical protein SAMN02910353_02778 [Ruminococcus sp. YRD2003]|uniref:hypothetical protein n=1 Tax=Ruminococcus sp. YRD2003 TaxID=1452313 RepID=UPI0008C5DB7C|nr:hypothetical protein SAMN02910353_02778 [Ruminococcus flavefaciens]